MTTYSYFVLKTSDTVTEKKFRVVSTGYSRVIQKAQSVDYTIDGNVDMAVGSLREQHNYLVKIRETEPITGYGDRDDLIYFFSLNNPNGTPTNVITMTDHYGLVHQAVMVGTFEDNTLSVLIEGDTAWSIAKCSFLFI